MNTVLPERVKNATSRMRALMDGAIRQVRHTGLPDEARSNSTAACASGTRRPQKCAVWTVVDSRTAAKHTTARQLNPFGDRYRMFTVLNATGDLDAPTQPLSGSQPDRIWSILASKGRPDPTQSSALVTEERLFGRFQFFSPPCIHLGIRKVQPIERIDDDCGHGQAGEPFVVRGDDQPGCMGRSSVRDHVFVGVHVVIPVFALLEVGARNGAYISIKANTG